MHTLASGIRKIVFILASLAALGSTAHAADPPPRLLIDRQPAERPTLLVLGTAHFASPGRDMVNIQVEDVLTEPRQAQIEDVVRDLAAFHPTVIAIEWPEAQQDRLDSLYGEYRAGRQALNASEHQQLGWRLADRLNLPRVHAIDWNGMPPGEMTAYNYPAWAKDHGRMATVEAIGARTLASFPQLGREDTVRQWLMRMNRPEALLDNHRVYLEIATLGDSESQPGAAWVGTWYARNLRIFTNLTRLTSNPQDRILVIYGVGHAYLLRQFARESNAFHVVDVDRVLKAQ
jgi:hypothetical protein